MKKTLIVSLMILSLCVSLTGCFGAAVTTKSVSESLSALGFTEKALLPGEKDHIENEIANQEEARSGDYYLYSTASFEDVLKTVYDACKKASDDEIVRDFITEDPMEFAYDGEEIVWFGYKHDGTFYHVAVSVYAPAAEVAVTEAATEAATEAVAASEAATEAATEAAAEESENYTIYLLQWE